ncbi:LysR substrate-binding domain-containing protein, partial [Escherichia coli]
DLAGLELYVFGHTCHYRRQVDRWLAESGIQPRATLEIESYPSLFACIEAGLGFACVPESFVARMPSNATGFPCRTGSRPGPRRPRTLCVRPHLPLPPPGRPLAGGERYPAAC